jgi:HAMP domain-containing protein
LEHADEVTEALSSGATVATLARGRRELAVVVPVSHDAERCESPRCHSGDREILGAVALTLNTDVLAGHERQQILIILAVGGLTFILVGAAATYGLRRTVIKPITELETSAERLSEGDYSARAEVKSADELGILAKTFNEMAQRVESRTHEIQELNTELEDRVLQRTEELSAMNTLIRAASNSLNLDTILHDTLDKVMPVVQTDVGIVHLDTDGHRDCLVAQGDKVMGSLMRGQGTPLTECPAGQIVAGGESAGTDEAFGAASVDLPEGTGFGTLVSVPIKSKGRVLGSLCFFSKEERAFEAKQIQLLETMGEAVGVSVENAQVAEKLEEANSEIYRLIEQAMRGGFDVAYDNPNLQECWVEKGCRNYSCPCYEVGDVRCWQVVGTFSGDTPTCLHCAEPGGCAACEIYRELQQHDVDAQAGGRAPRTSAAATYEEHH